MDYSNTHTHRVFSFPQNGFRATPFVEATCYAVSYNVSFISTFCRVCVIRSGSGHLHR
jgi:hypothetical protein